VWTGYATRLQDRPARNYLGTQSQDKIPLPVLPSCVWLVVGGGFPLLHHRTTTQNPGRHVILYDINPGLAELGTDS
ncbi:MAG: hypothetical protein ABIK62_03930, partial [candidate division WOR-3 bacterium]